MWLLVFMTLFVASDGTAIDFNGNAVAVDVIVPETFVVRPMRGQVIEAVVVEHNIDFDDMNISYVAGIRILYPGNRAPPCDDLSKLRHPWECTAHFFDAKLTGDGDVPLATFAPADRFVNFRTPFASEFENGYLQLGRATGSAFATGRLSVRFAFVDERTFPAYNTTHVATPAVVFTFYVLHAREASCLLPTGILTVPGHTKTTDDKLFVSSSPQSRSVFIAEDTIRAYLDVNRNARNPNLLRIMGMSVTGSNWLTSYSVEFLFDNMVLHTLDVRPHNYWTQQSLLPLSKALFLTNRTAIHVTCRYASVKYPFVETPLQVVPPAFLAVGDASPAHAGCTLQLQVAGGHCANQILYDADRAGLRRVCNANAARDRDDCEV